MKSLLSSFTEQKSSLRVKLLISFVAVCFLGNPLFAQIVTTAPASRCNEGIVTLHATASSGTIMWYTVPFYGTTLTPGGASSYTTPYLTESTTYYVDAIDGTGCSLNSGKARVPVIASVSAGNAQSIIFYASNSFCKSITGSQLVSQTGSGGGTYTVSPSGLTLDATTGAITPNTSTANAYTVTYTPPSTAGCTQSPATTSVSITLAPSTSSIAYSGSSYCTSSTDVTPIITNPNGGVFSAIPSGLTINSSTGVISPSSSLTGSYTISYFVSGSGGCAPQTATATVGISGLPTASINYVGANFCKSNSTGQLPTLTGTNIYTGGTYSSTTGLTIDSSTGAITPSTSTAGTYTVTYTIPVSGPCAAVTTQKTVIINPLPSASIAVDNSTVCMGATDPVITFTGTIGTPPYTFTYHVNSGTDQTISSTSSSSTVTIVQPTISAGTSVYTLSSVSDNYACPKSISSNNTVSVSVTAIPVATFAYQGSPFCQTGSATPTMTGGGIAGTFSAGTGVIFVSASTGEIDLLHSTAGTYTITNTLSGCGSISATSSIVINALPTISLTPTPDCGFTTLTASTNSTSPLYIWYKDATVITGATGATYQATVTGGYTVSVADGNTNCTNTSAVSTISSIYPVPTVTITADNLTACGQSNLSSSVTNTTAYQWYKNNTAISGATSSTYAATVSGTYKLTVSGAGSCTATSPALNIIINAVPTATISGTLTACGSTVLTAATTAASPVYGWYKDNAAITDATSSTYTANASGSYKVTISDQSTLCSTTSVASGVTINSAPNATITASSGTVTYGSTTTYTAVTGMSTYSWAITGDGTITSGAGTNQITVLATAATNYNLTLTVTNSSGCQNSSASVVYVSPVVLTAATTIANKLYDGSATSGSVTLGTISGLIGSETLTITPTAANYANANVGTSKATTISYALANGSGGLASNYSMANLASSGNITQKALTAVTTVASKQYDGLATAGTVTLGTVSGLVGSETLTITPTAGNYSNANVATGKAITISYALANGSGGLASNYSMANLSTTGNINQMGVTVTAVTNTKTYNGTIASAGTPTVGTLASGDAVNVAPTQVFDNVNVGTSHVLTASGLTIKNTSSVDVTSNYTISYTASPSTGVISKMGVTVTAVTDTKTYNGSTASAGTPTVGTLASGDAVNVAPTQVFDNVNVGTSHVLTASGLTIKNSSSVDVTSNYTISYTVSPSTGVITAIQLTIATPTLTTVKTYNNTTTTVVTAGALSGVLSAEAANVTVAATATYNDASVAIGKTITVVYSLSGTAITNYTKPVNFTTTSGEIDPVAPTGTASQSFCGN